MDNTCGYCKKELLGNDRQEYTLQDDPYPAIKFSLCKECAERLESGELLMRVTYKENSE